ncbi:MAG: NAD(+)/NADH kinase, partial [Prevotella sp.]|nr:NAD(+)/NADH kinase [Prevotella sp.]
IGVNIGRLGFLADVRDDEIEQAFSAIYEGRYRIEEHAVISLTADSVPQDFIPHALNDIAVMKRDNASMITIYACVDGDPLVTYQADGLVVSTPTGSTAYNLSNGGPIMLSQTEVLCLTPIAPHSLSIRPIVVPNDCVIELEVESRSHNFLVAVDGRSATLDEQVRIRIGKADHKVKIVKRESENFFSTLREKMMWGKDVREK